MPAIRPFVIDIPEETLIDLNDRLEWTRWPDRELVADWTQGIPLSYVKDFCEYWQHTYDWRETENRLNALDNYLITIDNVDIHCIVQKSTHEESLPLLITHGWPGSVVEFLHAIPLLCKRQSDDGFGIPCHSAIVAGIRVFQQAYSNRLGCRQDCQCVG